MCVLNKQTESYQSNNPWVISLLLATALSMRLLDFSSVNTDMLKITQ